MCNLYDVVWAMLFQTSSESLEDSIDTHLSLLFQTNFESPEDSTDTQHTSQWPTTQAPSTQGIYNMVFTNTCLNDSMYKSLGHR